MGNKPKILIIEDEQTMRDLIRLTLERNGFDALEANGGWEGLDLARKERPDLILLDLMMPDVDGWEVHRQLKADDELEDIPIIVVTILGRNTDSVFGSHITEVDDYITKPFSTSRLVSSINRVLGRS
jgi:DNA-binding response OmpR family regulator